jgi:hypothetical protein
VQQKTIPAEALLDLCRRLDILAPRSPERRLLMRETAQLYGVSEVTLYRALRLQVRPRALRRSDRGEPRVLPKAALERYCEILIFPFDAPSQQLCGFPHGRS